MKKINQYTRALFLVLMVSLFTTNAWAWTNVYTEADLKDKIGTCSDELRLANDIDLTSPINVESGTTAILNIHGHILRLTAATGSVINNAGNLTVVSHDYTTAQTQEEFAGIRGGVITGGKGTEIDGKTYGGGIYNTGTLTIKGGFTITSNTADFGGGVYTANSNVTLRCNNNDYFIIITGNTDKNGNKSNLCINSTGETTNTIIPEYLYHANTNIGITTMKDGVEGCYKFIESTSTGLQKFFSADNDDYVIRCHYNGYYDVTTPVCKIGEKGYATVKEAIDNATTGDVIQLIADSDIRYYADASSANNKISIASGKTLTLDFNGYVLSQASTTCKDVALVNNGNLTIKDSRPNSVHYFTVDSDERWIINADQTTPANYKEFENLAARPAVGDVIAVKGGGITTGLGVGVYNQGTTLNIEGGNIIGFNGKGLYNYSGSLNITGGKICGNVTSTNFYDQNGGGINVRSGNVTIDGSTISFNKSNSSGGGIYSSVGCTLQGNFIVSYNKAASNGGGIYFSCYSTPKLIGGEISHNISKYYGGVNVTSSYGIEVGGAIKIQDNTRLDGITKSDVGVDGYYGTYFIKISTGTTALASGANIGVLVVNGAMNPKAQKFTSNGTANDAQYFFSDNATYYTTYNSSGYLETKASQSVATEDALKNTISSGASVKLTADVDLTSELGITDGQRIAIDLNGYVLKQTTASQGVISNAGTLTIVDSKPTATHTGVLVSVTGGVITGGSATNGGGINNTGTLYLEAGTITGNKSDNGGGVYTNNSDVTVSGKVVITGNTKADGSTKSNLYITSTTDTPNTLTLGSMTTGANISITSVANGADGEYKFTSNGTADDAQYFSSDLAKYIVKYNNSGYLGFAVIPTVTFAEASVNLKLNVEKEVKLNLEKNGKKLSSLQMNITLPEGLELVNGSATLGSIATDASLAFKNYTGTTKYSVIITENNRNEFTADGQILSFKVKATNGVSGAIAVTNIIGSTVAAERFNLAGVSADALVPVCTIGTKGYASFESAIAAVSAGQTILLIEDVDLTSTLEVTSGKDFTLDLNGHTLNGSSITPAGSPVVENNGKLTITDSSTDGGGKITGAKSDKGGVYTSTNDLTLSGKVIITGNTMADGTTPRNLYLNDVTAKVDGLVEGANIGVTTAKSGTEGAYQFTSNGDESATQYFVADNTAYGTHFNAVGGGTDYLSLAAWKLGDADLNMNVRVNDYNTVMNYVLTPATAPTVKTTVEFLSADANENKSIEVGDLTKIVDITFNEAVSQAKGITATTAATAVNGFRCNISGNILTLSADNASEFIAAQMDITLPEGISVAKAESTGHTVSYKAQEDGAVRLLIAGLDNNRFSGNTVATVTLTGNATSASIANAIFANTAFQSVKATAGSATGISNVDANVDVNRDGKFLENGKVIILKSGKKYNTNGQQMK